MVTARSARVLCLTLPVMTMALGACRDRERRAVAAEDASFGRRVFKAPTGEVRALPPHNIHRNGVGPYELQAGFQKTLALLPSGPRVELFKAEGLFDYRLMRADNDTLVLGVGRHGLLDFISVLDPDIARTESGVGVGAGLEELVGALGAVREPLDSGRDPRIVTFSSLPDTRFIVEDKKVVAAVVMPSRIPEPPPTVVPPQPVIPATPPVVPVAPPPPEDDTCQADDLLELRDRLLELAHVSAKKAAVVTGCLFGDQGEAVIRSGNTIKIVSTEGGAGPKLWGELEVEGLRFAAIVATGAGRPDLYTVSQRQDLQVRQVEVTRYRLVGGRISPAWTRIAFGLEATSASWIGAKISAADFLVELQGTDGAVIVGGLYVQREGAHLRMVVPVDPVEMPVAWSPRKEEGPAQGGSGEVDGGRTEASVDDIAP